MYIGKRKIIHSIETISCLLKVLITPFIKNNNITKLTIPKIVISLIL